MEIIKTAKYIKSKINLSIVGSIKRKCDKPNNINFVGLIGCLELLKQLNLLFEKVEPLIIESKFLNVKVDDKYEIIYFKALSKEHKKILKVIKTIDKKHIIAYRKRAKLSNLQLNDYGLFTEEGDQVLFKNEDELKTHLKLIK